MREKKKKRKWNREGENERGQTNKEKGENKKTGNELGRHEGQADSKREQQK